MDTATRTAIASTVSGLSDNQLLEQTGKLARLDHQIQVFVIDHLLEIETRRVYLSRGFSGLFDYVARGLGYSDAAAWRRINAMKLCAQVEEAHERRRDGSLTLDAAAQLQAAFERRDRERARTARGGGAGVGLATKPSGSAPSPPTGLPERKPAPELDASPLSRRDRGCCSYVDPVSERRCVSRRLLQVDHVFPYALGGSAEAGNPRPLQ